MKVIIAVLSLVFAIVSSIVSFISIIALMVNVENIALSTIKMMPLLWAATAWFWCCYIAIVKEN